MILRIAILLGVVYLGYLLVHLFHQKLGKGYKLLLTFSGAFLIGMIFLHLAPEVYGSLQLGIGWWVMGGFLLQVLLEWMSKGAEHGHIHPNDGGKIPLTIFISLCLHAYIESMPLGGSHHHDFQQTLLIGLFNLYIFAAIL